MFEVCGDRGEAEITDMMDVVNRIRENTRESTRRNIWRIWRSTRVMMMIRMRVRMRTRHDSTFDLKRTKLRSPNVGLERFGIMVMRRIMMGKNE